VSSHRKGEEIIFEKYCIKGKRKRKTIKLVLNLCTFTHKTAQYQTLKKRYFVYLYDINLQLCHDCCCLLQGQQQLFRGTHAKVLTHAQQFLQTNGEPRGLNISLRGNGGITWVSAFQTQSMHELSSELPALHQPRISIAKTNDPAPDIGS
jgi:hypothetical protein